MPAPRYVNEFQENAVWVGLTGLWCLGGLSAWLGAVGSSATWIGSSSLVALLAALISGISIALRMPILTAATGGSSAAARSDDSRTIEHGIWLLGTLASLNWLGFLILQAPQWSEALPVVLLMSVGEVWFHTTAWRQSALPWLHGGIVQLLSKLARLGCDPHPRSADPPYAAANAVASLTEDEVWDSGSCECSESQLEPDVDQLADGIDRRQVHGVDESGRSYWSGAIRVQFASGQQIQQVVVAFAPPFTKPPQVDWEIELDDAQVRLVNCTPTGMRLEIRRISDQEPLIFPLQWYAAELELGNMAAASNAQPGLP